VAHAVPIWQVLDPIPATGSRRTSIRIEKAGDCALALKDIIAHCTPMSAYRKGRHKSQI